MLCPVSLNVWPEGLLLRVELFSLSPAEVGDGDITATGQIHKRAYGSFIIATDYAPFHFAQ